MTPLIQTVLLLFAGTSTGVSPDIAITFGPVTPATSQLVAKELPCLDPSSVSYQRADNANFEWKGNQPVPMTITQVDEALWVFSEMGESDMFLGFNDHGDFSLTAIVREGRVIRFDPPLVEIPNHCNPGEEVRSKGRFVIHKPGNPDNVMSRGTFKSRLCYVGHQEVQGPCETGLAHLIAVNRTLTVDGDREWKFRSERWYINGLGLVASRTNTTLPRHNSDVAESDKCMWLASKPGPESNNPSSTTLTSHLPRKLTPIPDDYWKSTDDTKQLNLGIATTRIPRQGTVQPGKSQLYANVLFDQDDKSKTVIIMLDATRNRGHESLERAVGGMIGSQMMQYRQHGWNLRRRGVYRLQGKGTRYGRFDYSIRATDGVRINNAVVLVPGPGRQAVKIELASRIPFSQWGDIEKTIRTILLELQWTK